MRAGGVLVVAFGLILATDAAAQNRVQIFGTVVDDKSGEPIAQVNVFARNHADQYLQRSATDDAGRFAITVYRVSAVRLSASRFGYQRTVTPLLHFDGNDYFEVEIRMDPEVLLLAPLEVIARGEAVRSPVLAGFRHRMTRGTGYYITRADIERRQPLYVTDLLTEVPGVRLSSSGRGSRREVYIGRSAGIDCSVQLFVDGRLINPRFLAAGPRPDPVTLDDVVAPESVEGIEVYRGLSTVPPEFYNPDAACGVVAVWTRRGTHH